MSDLTGHIELERTIDSILVGARHRDDLGDIEALMQSVQRLGLLQPVTVTPDGVLVCGRRRLEAVKRLGWRTLRVWVRSGISDDLSRLLAERDENEQRKDLDEVEQARLYAEIKVLLTEDAARRQEATRFSTTADSVEEAGGGDSPPPLYGTGKARDQASHLITGSASYHRHEQVDAIRKVAEDPHAPDAVRELASRELDAIRVGAKVHGAYTRVKDALALAAPSSRTNADDGVHRLSADALARAKAEQTDQRAQARRQARPDKSRRTTRAFLLTWGDLDDWSAHYDASEIAEELSDRDWEMFERVLAETQAFADVVRRARSAARELIPT